MFANTDFISLDKQVACNVMFRNYYLRGVQFYRRGPVWLQVFIPNKPVWFHFIFSTSSSQTTDHMVSRFAGMKMCSRTDPWRIRLDTPVLPVNRAFTALNNKTKCGFDVCHIVEWHYSIIEQLCLRNIINSGWGSSGRKLIHWIRSVLAPIPSSVSNWCITRIMW